MRSIHKLGIFYINKIIYINIGVKFYLNTDVCNTGAQYICILEIKFSKIYRRAGTDHHEKLIR